MTRFVFADFAAISFFAGSVESFALVPIQVYSASDGDPRSVATAVSLLGGKAAEHRRAGTTDDRDATLLPWNTEVRMRKGINPKTWFYGLREALVAEQNRPCIFAGAACEQWINGELFRVITRGLDGTRLTAFPEWNGRQHDVAVLRHDPSDREAWLTPAAVVECKVVYPNYSAGKRKQYIDRLIEQLTAPHSENPLRAGFFIAIYTAWPEYKEATESFSEFRLSVGRLLRARANQGAPGFTIRMGHAGSLETFLHETPAKIGAADVVVGCIGQYIRLHPT